MFTKLHGSLASEWQHDDSATMGAVFGPSALLLIGAKVNTALQGTERAQAMTHTSQHCQGFMLRLLMSLYLH